MKKFALICCMCALGFGFDFGLQVGKMSSSEVDAYFNLTYAQAEPFACSLKSSFLPNTSQGRVLERMLGGKDASKNLRSISCVINNRNYFIWLVFKDDVLKQLKYEVQEDYEKLKSEIEQKHHLIISSSAELDDYYVSSYAEFMVDENTICKSEHCRKFSIFEVDKNTRLLLIDASFNTLQKSSVIIRTKDLANLYQQAALKSK